MRSSDSHQVVCLPCFFNLPEALGPDHVHVALMYENLARALGKQHRNKEADVYTRRAKAIRDAAKE